MSKLQYLPVMVWFLMILMILPGLPLLTLMLLFLPLLHLLMLIILLSLSLLLLLLLLLLLILPLPLFPHPVHFQKTYVEPFGNMSPQLRGAWCAHEQTYKISREEPPHSLKQRQDELRKGYFFVSRSLWWRLLISVLNGCGQILSELFGVFPLFLLLLLVWLVL